MRSEKLQMCLSVVLFSIGITYFSCHKDKYVVARYILQLMAVSFSLCVAVSEAVFINNHTTDPSLLTHVISTELTCIMVFVKLSCHLVYRRDFQDVVDALVEEEFASSTELACIMVFVKLSCHLVYRRDFQDVVDALVEEEFASRLPLVRYAMRPERVGGARMRELRRLVEESRAELSRTVYRLLLLYCLAGYGTGTCMLLSHALIGLFHSEGRAMELPYGMAFPWNVQQYYGISYCIQIFALVNICSALLGLDVLFALVVGHVMRQLRIVGFVLSKKDAVVAEVDEPGSKQWERDTTIILANCADHYVSLKRLVATLNKANAPFFITQSVCTSVIICICLFKIASTEDKFSLEIYQYYMYTITSFMQMGVYCVSGQLLVNEWERLQECMLSGWWRHGVRHRSCVRILQAQLQWPMRLSIWGSTHLSYRTYVMVVKTAFSYFALLKSLME